MLVVLMVVGHHDDDGAVRGHAVHGGKGELRMRRHRGLVVERIGLELVLRHHIIRRRSSRVVAHGRAIDRILGHLSRWIIQPREEGGGSPEVATFERIQGGERSSRMLH